MTEQQDRTEEKLASVEEVLGRSELFIEKNQKKLLTGLAVIIIVVLGFFGYHKFIQGPKELKASKLMFTAEKYFDQDSISKALNGDGDHLGFVQIINDFGGTKSGNLAKYYAGVCNLKLGNYKEAVDFLGDFSADDEIIAPMAIGAQGDAYLELGEAEKAAKLYVEAAQKKINAFTSPQFLFKAGLTYESLNNNSKALEMFENIKSEYPKSEEARTIDKYIARVQG
ncbi:MAG: tol-pal system YbgF family protein [Bacteroidales bacterium]